MNQTKWKKAYKGPFLKQDAENHVYSLKHDSKFKEKTQILDARIRLRRKPKAGKQCVCTAACGAGLGHNKMYDVFIKTIRTEI